MGATTQSDTKRLLLVWDMPNIGISRAGVIRTQPNSTNGLAMAEFSAWLQRRASLRGLTVSATVFMNVPAHGHSLLASRSEALLAAGFAVHAQPVVTQGDDVDALMAGHVRSAVARGDVAEVIVASHDRLAFAPLLAKLTENGIRTSVLGYAKFASWVESWPTISFIDLRVVADWARLNPSAADACESAS